MLTRRLLPLLATLVILVGSPAAAVLAAPPGGECPPGQTDCHVYDEIPGKGKPGNGNNNDGGGGDGKCYYAGEEAPCHDDVLGWLGSDGCYYRLAEPQGPPQDDGGGRWYTMTCPAGTDTVWLDAPPAELPDPEPIARALAAVTLQEPDINLKPDQGPGLVGLPVWLWVEQTENGWGPVSDSTSQGGLVVTINARATGLSFEVGDGKTIQCPTGGTPYPKGATGPSPDCGYVYAKAGDYTIAATTTWTVEWESNTGISGTINGETRTSEAAVRIDELQVVTE
ncbi:hypothetical protein WEI85_06840 [Actinomycetes bacterium KLBMP 9797]